MFVGEESDTNLNERFIHRPSVYSLIVTFIRDTNADHRCDGGRLWLSAQHCQLPSPTSQKLRYDRYTDLEIERLPMSPCARSTRIHQLLEELHHTLPSSPKSRNFRQVGIQHGQSNLNSFLEYLSDEAVFYWTIKCIFGILKSPATH